MFQIRIGVLNDDANIHKNKMKPTLYSFAHWHFSGFLRFLKLYAGCLSCSLGLFGGDRTRLAEFSGATFLGVVRFRITCGLLSNYFSNQ